LPKNFIERYSKTIVQIDQNIKYYAFLVQQSL